MIILDSKRKDYYDYMVSILGRDEGIVYDRKGSKELDHYKDVGVIFEVFFLHTPTIRDKVKQWKNVYRHKLKKWTYKKEKMLQGEMYYFALEVGFNRYLFEVERYLDDNDKNMAHIEPKLIEVKHNCERVSKEFTAPINIFVANKRYSWISEDKEINIETKHHIENPILSSSYFPKFIGAEEIYNEVYDYLLKIKEPEIVDSRSNKEKIESHGFSYKDSFRNVK